MACTARVRRLPDNRGRVACRDAIACLAFCSVSRRAAANSVQVCSSNPDFFVFGGARSNAHIHAQALCPVGTFNGAGLAIFNSGNASAGRPDDSRPTLPRGWCSSRLNVNQIVSVGVNDGGGWGGGFYWAGGGAETNDKTNQHPNFGASSPLTSPYFGIQMICGKATCKSPAPARRPVGDAYTFERRSGRASRRPVYGSRRAGFGDLESSFRGSTRRPELCVSLRDRRSTWPSSSSAHLNLGGLACSAATPAINADVNTPSSPMARYRSTLGASDAANVPAGTTPRRPRRQHPADHLAVRSN